MLTEDFGSLDWSVRRNERCFIKLVFFLFSFCVRFDVRYGLLMHYSRETTGKKNLHQRIIRRTILNNLIKNKLKKCIKNNKQWMRSTKRDHKERRKSGARWLNLVGINFNFEKINFSPGFRTCQQQRQAKRERNVRILVLLSYRRRRIVVLIRDSSPILKQVGANQIDREQWRGLT